MSDFFELFNPGERFAREQRDLDKVLIVEDEDGGAGPKPLDLDSGAIVLRMPSQPDDPEAEQDRSDDEADPQESAD